MDEEFLLKAVTDKMEGWELVEFLNISIEDVVEAFRDRIIDNIDDVEDFLN